MKYIFNAPLLILLALSPSLVLGKERVQLLATGGHAFASIHNGIQSSQRSIDATYYIFEPCHTSGRIIVDALTQQVRATAAKGRQIPVRLLLDAFGADKETKHIFAAVMRKRGIDVKYFQDLPKFIPSFNVRNHTKFIVFDQKSVISGGRNIGDEYFALSPEMNFIDKDVRVTGSSAAEASVVFESYWNSHLSRRPNKKATAQEMARFENSCLALRSFEKEVIKRIPKQLSQLNSQFPQRQCSNVQFVSDRINFNPNNIRERGDIPQGVLDQKYTTKAVLDLILSAKSSVSSENFSYLATSRIRKAFLALAKRGVEVNIVTNALTTDDDNISLASQYTARKHEKYGVNIHFLLSNAGNRVENWIHRPTDADTWFLHSKTFTADEQSAIVSSFNIDPRSYATNYESAVVVKNCPSFVADVDSQIWLHMQKAIEAEERGEESDEDPGLGKWLKMLLTYDFL